MSEQHSGLGYEYATVNEDPGTSGYGTKQINISKLLRKGSKGIDFIISGTGTMTITLQYKIKGVSIDWEDDDTFTSNIIKEVNGAKGRDTLIRAVVKDDDWTSGSKTFGFSY